MTAIVPRTVAATSTMGKMRKTKTSSPPPSSFTSRNGITCRQQHLSRALLLAMSVWYWHEQDPHRHGRLMDIDFNEGTTRKDYVLGDEFEGIRRGYRRQRNSERYVATRNRSSNRRSSVLSWNCQPRPNYSTGAMIALRISATSISNTNNFPSSARSSSQSFRKVLVALQSPSILQRRKRPGLGETNAIRRCDGNDGSIDISRKSHSKRQYPRCHCRHVSTACRSRRCRAAVNSVLFSQSPDAANESMVTKSSSSRSNNVTNRTSGLRATPNAPLPPPPLSPPSPKKRRSRDFPGFLQDDLLLRESRGSITRRRQIEQNKKLAANSRSYSSKPTAPSSQLPQRPGPRPFSEPAGVRAWDEVTPRWSRQNAGDVENTTLRPPITTISIPPHFPELASDSGRREDDNDILSNRDTTGNSTRNTRAGRNKSVDNATQQSYRLRDEYNDDDAIISKYSNGFLQNTLEWMYEVSFEPALQDIIQNARRTRLLRGRAYARPEPFEKENISVPPSLGDLRTRDRGMFEGFWISLPARVFLFTGSTLLFPYLTQFLDRFVTMEPAQLDSITSKFGPGISILYGTFVSLTLSILYSRQRDIQDNVAVECSCLVAIIRHLLALFRDDRTRAVEAAQCAADQIRTLVRSSRGAELLLLMYTDPYARMVDLVNDKEYEVFEHQAWEFANANIGSTVFDRTGQYTNLIASCRDLLKDLQRFRAHRLSDEALALPPTHFLVLNTLTFLILLGFTASILPTVDVQTGTPSRESSLLFGTLTTVYILFYYFAQDLNNPFQGVYQLRRSCAASHLLEAKWLLANHPLVRDEVDFEEVQVEAAGVRIRSPGLGDLWFERDDIYIDPDSLELDNVDESKSESSTNTSAR